jgi:hypothetical protein
MLLLELLLVVQEVQLPSWFFPFLTPHDIVTFLHRLFPSIMNGGRCITAALYVDKKAVRVQALEQLEEATKDVTMQASKVCDTVTSSIAAQYAKQYEEQFLSSDDEDENKDEDEEEGGLQVISEDEQSSDNDADTDSSYIVGQGVDHLCTLNAKASRSNAIGMRQRSTFKIKVKAGRTDRKIGLMERSLLELEQRMPSSKEGRNALNVNVSSRVQLIGNPAALNKPSQPESAPTWMLLRDIALFLVARFLFIKAK